MQKTRKQRFSREIDRTPLDATGKMRLAQIKEYYRKCDDAKAKGESPPPLPEGWIKSPLDKPAERK